MYTQHRLCTERSVDNLQQPRTGRAHALASGLKGPRKSGCSNNKHTACHQDNVTLPEHAVTHTHRCTVRLHGAAIQIHWRISSKDNNVISKQTMTPLSSVTVTQCSATVPSPLLHLRLQQSQQSAACRTDTAAHPWPCSTACRHTAGTSSASSC